MRLVQLNLSYGCADQRAISSLLAWLLSVSVRCGIGAVPIWPVDPARGPSARFRADWVPWPSAREGDGRALHQPVRRSGHHVQMVEFFAIPR